MRTSLILSIAALIAFQQAAYCGDRSKVLSEAEKAKIKAQVEALQKANLKAGEASEKAINQRAAQQTQAIGQEHAAKNAQIDKKVQEWSWVVGPDAAKVGGDARKKAITEQMRAEQAKVLRDAQDAAAGKQTAAKQKAAGVTQTVKGLKSQVSADGKYGLQPKGSSLYVRQYGTNSSSKIATEITPAATEMSNVPTEIDGQTAIAMRHAILHSAGIAMCCLDWDELEGNDFRRVCPQCDATVFRIQAMDDAALVEAARKHHLEYQKLRAFRKLDGTYTFTTNNCSPKGFLTPLKSDFRSFIITNWWTDRYKRYLRYLTILGFAVGLPLTAVIATFTGLASALFYFGFYAVFCALAANLFFGISIVANSLVPGMLGPCRRFAGPVLLVGSMVLIALMILVPALRLVAMYIPRY